MLARVVTVIARVCTRLACTHLHLPRPACTLTKAPPSPPCPVASLARGIVIRVPSKSFSTARKNRRLQNLSHPACATRPPSCAPAHAPPSSHRRLQWPSASCTCTSAMHERDRPGVHGVLHLVQARNPQGCGVQESSKLATPTDALRNSKRRSKFVQHSQSSESASRCSTALTFATTCAETEPEQSSRTAMRCGTARET